MEALQLWTCDDGLIRINNAGQASVFDMIKTLGGKKNPRQVYSDLVARHPEVVQKTDSFRFRGRGQQNTPVTKDKESALYILGLLPGEVGRRYREQSAKLFVRWLEDPAGLVGDLADKLTEDEKLRLEARLKGIRTRRQFTDVLKEFGVLGLGYAYCTNAIYESVLGASARGLKGRIAERKGLQSQRSKSSRSHDHYRIRGCRNCRKSGRRAASTSHRGWQRWL